MEINKYSDIRGVVAQEDIVEGRMVLIVANAAGTHDFGSRGDLPGIKLPDDTTEAALAKFVSGFALDNRSTPIYQPTPAYSYQLRGGYGVGADNVPITGSTIYLSHPGNMIGQTIPSGELALAFGGGVFTVTSGHFVPNANLVPGAHLVVADTASDGAASAGKLKYSATAGVATVEKYDSTNLTLTFRTLNP